ncbi:MAG TPA: Hpt domain-containing protein, partial [Ramlibacter sp.]|nr:Hpt domain-containing protein [Ramlibacter sp.]
MEAATDIDLATNDLGPLAWVLDELRKSLESASAALRRFVRDAGLARGSDMASVDAGQLRIARQQLHQAVGALEMVGLAGPAQLLRSMEAAAQKFVERPELCSEAAASKVERAGFALTEYLEGVLLGKTTSPVALFPQYKDVQELAGADRIHPADLWPFDWRWIEPETPAVAQALTYDPAVRSRMDQAVLRIVKAAEPAAARELAECSLGLAASQTARQPKVFWKLCAGYFEAMALSLLPADLFVKRGASRVLLQYATLAKGELGISDRLAQDLLFFCAQAVPPQPLQAPALAGVRAAYGLARFTSVDYTTPQFGRFDPTLLAQARKRIGVAKETWSALSGGDVNKLKAAAEQFHLIGDSLAKLHPPSAPLAQALGAMVDAVLRSGQAPRPEVAMEVATAVLYLEAAFQDLDPTDAQLAARTARLAERLDQVRQGGAAQALEPWMEELYRRVSDRQTMGSVVGELRATLGELEKLLDGFFRNPQDKEPLKNAPTHLLQMRGVLSVLALDHASQAVLRMRESIEGILLGDVEQARAGGAFEKLGNNLGALGFLIDMLNYQPTLAKKLFVYDAAAGELRPLMGRAGEPVPQPEAQPPGPTPAPIPMAAPAAAAAPVVEAPAAVAAPVALEPVEAAPVVVPPPEPAPVAAAPAPMAAPAAAPLPVAQDDGDAELREIFLEEAREVVGNGLAAIQALGTNPGDVSELTTLRRAFHTLKGSSRMVGLNDFGEAGWAMEQVLNTWLADQKPADDALRTLSREAMEGFARWIEDIAARVDGGWKSTMFRVPADALRMEGRLLPIAAAASPAPAEPTEDAPDIGLEFDLPEAVQAQPEPVPEPAAVPGILLLEPSAETAPSATPELSEESAFIDLKGLPDSEEAPMVAYDVGSPAAPAEQLAAADSLGAAADFELPSMDLPDAPAAPEAPAALDISALFEPEPPAAAPAAETPVEVPAFELDLDTAPVAEAAEAPVASAPEIDAIDFGSLEAIDTPQATPAVQPAVLEAPPFELPPMDLPASEAEGEPEPTPAAEPSTAAIDEQTKVIGGLRIGIPLYNVYLNEADEWSRRLATEVGEWALELNQPVPDSAVGLAHALGGASATVGFEALSDISRALEAALEHAQTLAYGTPAHGKAFVDAAEEIRRLLHQFAAGFLKAPDPRIVQALQALEQLDVPRRPEQGEPAADPLADLDFGTPEPVAAASVLQAEPITGLATEAAPGPTPDSAPEPASAPDMPALAVAGAAAAAAAVPTVSYEPAARLEGEDEIDVADAIDPDLFPIFEEEAVELLPQLGGSLRQWAQGDAAGRDKVLRALHTLKGSARL